MRRAGASSDVCGLRGNHRSRGRISRDRLSLTHLAQWHRFTLTARSCSRRLSPSFTYFSRSTLLPTCQSQRSTLKQLLRVLL